MPELTESVDVDAPPERVWAALTDWVRQGEWMLATEVRTVDGSAQEVGGRLAARTGVPLPGGRRWGSSTRCSSPGGSRRGGSTSGTPAGWSADTGIFEVQPRGELLDVRLDRGARPAAGPSRAARLAGRAPAMRAGVRLLAAPVRGRSPARTPADRGSERPHPGEVVHGRCGSGKMTGSVHRA